MLRFLADENLHSTIVRGLRRRNSAIDIVRVQEVGLTGIDDEALLAWAANDNRIVLTHDVQTMTKYAYDRVRAGNVMCGVFEIHRTLPISLVIDELLLLAKASSPDEWADQVRYLPLL